MNHWIIAPVILPALLAPVLAFVMRHDITLARVTSLAGIAAMTAISIGLVALAAGGETHVYYLGNWPAPFGIVLVLDRVSALMLLLTSVLALIVATHATATGWDARGGHFHALFQFLLMGICGAFLTGDAFNLFVFFEVLLIASYGLMIHGGGRVRLQAGLQYVVMNLAGSTLFLFGLAVLYAETGTLNIADLALRVREVPGDEAGLVRVAAVLLLMVFAIKAALFPVQFWLPGTYSNAPAPVAALFAVMTKVGAYAILRVHVTVFGPDVAATEGLVSTWLTPAAAVTVAVGAFGVLGARRLLPLIAFSVVASMGMLMLGVAAFTPSAVSASLYYLLHSTFAAAALFLIADLVVSRRAGDDVLATRPATVQNGLFAALFMAAAIGMAGMPPLSGFLGKLLILDALADAPHMALTWTVILAGSLLIIVGLARAGSTLFWKSTAVKDDTAGPTTAAARAWEIAPTLTTVAVLAALAAGAYPASEYLDAAAVQLFDHETYAAAVFDSYTGANPTSVAGDAANVMPDSATEPDASDPGGTPEAPAEED